MHCKFVMQYRTPLLGPLRTYDMYQYTEGSSHLSRPRLIYVAGRLQLEEPGEQCGKVMPSAPEEVRRIREAQLENGIVDMVAEQIRVLEEAHLPSQEAFGSARKVGSKKAVQEEGPMLELALPGSAVHLVTDEEGLKILERVLRERRKHDKSFRKRLRWEKVNSFWSSFRIIHHCSSNLS